MEIYEKLDHERSPILGANPYDEETTAMWTVLNKSAYQIRNRKRGAMARAKGQRKSIDKKREVIRNIPQDKFVEFLCDMYKSQKGLCALSGVKLTSDIHCPAKLSVDRIDSKKGYSFNNIRLVCTAVNYALNRYGEDAVRHIIKAWGSRL